MIIYVYTSASFAASLFFFYAEIARFCLQGLKGAEREKITRVILSFIIKVGVRCV